MPEPRTVRTTVRTSGRRTVTAVGRARVRYVYPLWLRIAFGSAVAAFAASVAWSVTR